MNVGSLFSGIGGLDLGLHRAGFRHAFFCESDEWRRGVLAAHWPEVPIYEDVVRVGEPAGGGAADGLRTTTDERRREAGARLPDDLHLLCGGFPCQDVSVAGRRRGLAGERSGLFFEFARIAESLRPRWLLVENVPGLLSSNGGRDFGAVLGTLADIGYGVGYRILDSRFFGVPQRRRRVFIVGALAVGDPRAAAERAGQVLAVGSRCPRHPATRGEAREDVAVASALGTGNGGKGGWRIGAEEAAGNQLVTVAHALTSEGHDASEDDTGRGSPLVAAPLSHGSNPNSNMAGRRREDDENLVAAFNWQTGGDFRLGYGKEPSLQKEQTVAVQTGSSVRRLTPRECERLQNLPDDWTAHGPDSRRYAALGDAVTASVAEWIGRRMLEAA